LKHREYSLKINLDASEDIDRTIISALGRVSRKYGELFVKEQLALWIEKAPEVIFSGLPLMPGESVIYESGEASEVKTQRRAVAGKIQAKKAGEQITEDHSGIREDPVNLSEDFKKNFLSNITRANEGE